MQYSLMLAKRNFFCIYISLFRKYFYYKERFVCYNNFIISEVKSNLPKTNIKLTIIFQISGNFSEQFIFWYIFSFKISYNHTFFIIELFKLFQIKKFFNRIF